MPKNNKTLLTVIIDGTELQYPKVADTYFESFKYLFENNLINESICDKLPAIGKKSKNDFSPVAAATSFQVADSIWVSSHSSTEVKKKNLLKVFEAFNINGSIDKIDPHNTEVNYWVFQGNPKYYDIVKSIQDENLKTWSVKAHKDKIKKGDKFILWATGPQSGCYALGEIISDVFEGINDDVELQYYLTEDDNSPNNRVQISITNDFTNNPILKSDIEGNSIFESFKGGNQGTNFNATKEQFEFFINGNSNTSNILDQFIEWLNQDVRNNYFDNDPAKTKSHLNKYNDFFDFDLFLVDFKNIPDFIKKIEATLYSIETNDFLEFSEKDSYHRPRAILGKKNYFEYLKSLKTSEFQNILTQCSDSEKLSFFSLLNQIIDELELSKNDQRVTYSCRDKRLALTIGQRYVVSLKPNDRNGSLGVITTEKLNQSSDMYGGTPPQPFYTYFHDLSLKEDNIKDVINTCNNELLKTRKSSFLKFSNQDFEDFVFDNDYPRTLTSSNKPAMKHALNTILYGPPGTGKTYNTAKYCAEILTGEDFTGRDDEARELFNNCLGNQIEFVTFHQNYSYEDFIQGLRPDIKSDNLSFDREDGIFKVISDRAARNLKASKESKVETIEFNDVFKTLFKELLEGEKDELEVKMKKVSYFITAISEKSIEFRKASGGTSHTMSIKTLEKMYEDESTLNMQGLASYYTPLLNQLLKLGKTQNAVKTQKQNYIIVIDEINRANISRVFGELITLIEDDKRSEGATPLKCKLPSGDEFQIPSNLFILGTMNTADKSIALLDIALRRRFEFVPLYPNPDLAKTEEKKNVLGKINQRIFKDKGPDFQIGHAYFMKNDKLEDCMNKKVVPLLTEYYMNATDEVIGVLKEAGFETTDKYQFPIKVTKYNG